MQQTSETSGGDTAENVGSIYRQCILPRLAAARITLIYLNTLVSVDWHVPVGSTQAIRHRWVCVTRVNCASGPNFSSMTGKPLPGQPGDFDPMLKGAPNTHGFCQPPHAAASQAGRCYSPRYSPRRTETSGTHRRTDRSGTPPSGGQDRPRPVPKSHGCDPGSADRCSSPGRVFPSKTREIEPDSCSASTPHASACFPLRRSCIWSWDGYGRMLRYRRVGGGVMRLGATIVALLLAGCAYQPPPPHRSAVPYNERIVYADGCPAPATLAAYCRSFDTRESCNGEGRCQWAMDPEEGRPYCRRLPCRGPR